MKDLKRPWQEEKYSWWLQPSDLKLCMVKQVVSCCQLETTLQLR